MRRRRTALGLLAALVVAACGAPPGPRVPDRPPARTDDAVVVTSFDFPESAIVGELYAQALERAGVPVRRELLLGPRELVSPALEQGLVDVVPEYLGTALAYLGGEQPQPADQAETEERLAEAFDELGVRLLEPAPAEDQNALVVTEGTALVYDLQRTSDLADVAAAFRFGGPPECPERTFCLKGLEEVYGLAFEEFVPLDSGGPLTVAALRDSDVDVGVLFSTDPHLVGGEFVQLEDDRSLQPAENVVPAVREPVLARWGSRLREPLDRVSEALTTEQLRELNARVVLEGETPRRAARDWLARLAAA
ncbi:MAG TPA: ABC transporter substrate-binding protein [Acidimicrobiales bacterium]|nr:ABC transporter substrate-binding protein [Acidimicrobiales bacterium]